MRITYDDIKHRLQPPLDCSELKDLRGEYVHNRLIINYENTDFTGCVLFHCFPNGIPNALEINPALSEEYVTLKGVDLRGANLKGAALTEANLKGTNLEGADLEGANLIEAYLIGADLEDADLTEADLTEADLSDAKYDEETGFEDSNITKEQLGSMVFVEDED